MTRTFALYPEARHWWSLEDYGAVLDTMLALKPERVLEFGPGSSTLALIEGGAKHIDTLEDAADWAEVYETRLQGKYPDIVRVHRYVWSDPLSTPVDGERYDLALIDGPLGTNNRPAVVRYALERCKAVLVPTEDKNPSYRRTLLAMADELGWETDIRNTGPLSGGFALFTRPEPKPKPEPEPEPVEDVDTPAEQPEPVPPMVGDDGVPVLDVPSVPPLSKRALKRQKKLGKSGA